ncbi:MAG: transcription elongation GreA/GreB family factor [Roseivirga sp.]|jgi:transcription elongation GreA/GreB family factor
MPISKLQLFQECLRLANARVTRLEDEMKALKDSAASDTKSSMGDKYETSTEMMNLEKGKIAEQLGEASRMKQTLNSLDLDKVYIECQLGTLVVTENASYFLATSIGKVGVEGSDFFVISPISPIGQQLLGKQVGDYINFGGKKVSIVKVE